MSTSTLAQLREIQQSIEEFKATLGAGVDDLEKKLGQSVKEVKKTLDVAVDDLASKLGPRWAELDGLLDRLVKALEESDDSKNPSETEDNEDHEAPVIWYDGWGMRTPRGRGHSIICICTCTHVSCFVILSCKALLQLLQACHLDVSRPHS
jgi:hypothetical protein